MHGSNPYWINSMVPGGWYHSKFKDIFQSRRQYFLTRSSYTGMAYNKLKYCNSEVPLHKIIFAAHTMTGLKQKIYDHCLRVINEKIESLQKILADLKESGSNETKSTAGDKHETALAMLQIEQANVRAQLQEVLEQKAALIKINPAIITASVVNGSLVRTDKGYFFISIPLGKTVIDGNAIIILSAQSPLGKKLMGQQTGGLVEINNNSYVIEQIV